MDENHDLKPIIEVAGEDEQGSLLMFIPRQIEPQPGDDVSPRLAVFPANLLYAGSRPGKEGTQLASCCYWHHPETYIEYPDRRIMVYCPKMESPYWIGIEYDLEKKSWSICKFKNQELVAISEGPELKGAIMHATLIGLQPDEPVDEDC